MEEMEIEVKENGDENQDKDEPNVPDLVKDWEANGKEGPRPGSIRWKEVYYDAQEGKRAREEVKQLREELSNNNSLIGEMRKHNEALIEVLEGNKSSKDEEKIASNIEKMETKLSDLREQKKAAREKSDFGAEDTIDEQIFDLRLQIKDFKKDIVSTKEKKEEKPVVREAKSGDDVELTEDDRVTIKAWKSENKWFDKSPKLRTAAIKFEKEIRASDDFEFATMEEILDEVKNKVEQKYKSNGGVDLVEGGDNVGGNLNLNKVKMSSTEMEIAKGFGLDPQQLAKQKLIINKENVARRRRSVNA